ncbi:uncharacterized ENTR1 family protein-like [Impatiens glandulifera]|uniref:uncharacterized ENTR1 family protein-like n=1 Tax=Impatiens glandulifera TaxID=253017 RepID=UPI001FB08735|nr:uncharacterized ENTR1 family protein-like [Impatiens glandulifera]
MTRDDDKDDWVQVAMENDALVVEFLIQLHQASPPRPPPTKTDSLPLEWSVRQPRSKSLSLNSNSNINNNNNNNIKNKNLPAPPPPPTRSSPTTPLSWSTGGATATSQSGSESSRRPSPPMMTMKCPDAPRSKVLKRPRKKKTLADLKEEEMLLMNEKRHLKKELEALRLNIENQRAINQNFKRLKIDKLAAASDVGEGVSYLKNGFSLPDLNIVYEEDL